MAPETMSPEEHEELRRAAELHRPIARAAALGRKNGLSLLVFGVLSLMFSLPGFDWLGLAIGAILTVTGFVEQRTSARLASADPAAPKILARNELVLMAGILVYCALKLTLLRETGEELAEELGRGANTVIDVERLTQSLGEAVYATFIAVTLLYQGGMARYFLRRRAMIDEYLAESPEWARRVVELRD